MDALLIPRKLPDGLSRSLPRLLLSLAVPPLVSTICFGLIAVFHDAREGKWLDLPGYILGRAWIFNRAVRDSSADFLRPLGNTLAVWQIELA